MNSDELMNTLLLLGWTKTNHPKYIKFTLNKSIIGVYWSHTPDVHNGFCLNSASIYEADTFWNKYKDDL